ncbi:alpha/beta fold hydrolase [Kribbella sp. NPDC004536]|uniref:alpha/beta fold hydrolase n=1 Tax=Kribbella sp. NPDC004536 TaxID=3364106 RepID=UPI00369F78F3
MTDPVAEAFGGSAARQELDRGGRMLRWVEAGSGTTVVLEAGATSPVVTYAEVFRDLATDHRVLADDRAGYGMSDPAPLSVELQVGDLVAVLQEVGPAVVVGHSWGELLAQLATWERPDLVSALVLLDPAHETFWQDAEPMPRADRTRPPAEDPRYQDLLTSMEELAEDIGSGSGCVRAYVRTDEQLFTLLDELPMILGHVGELAARRAAGVWRDVPVVVLTATKGRPVEFTPWVVAVQDRLATECGGRHLVVPDSGHYLQLDRPDLVVGCVRGTI